MKKVRLDQLVYELGFTDSRERAKTTVMSGLVFVNGQRADKPGMPVAPDAKIEVHGDALPFVSRGGFKLDKALKVFPVDPSGKVCIDCGASTGGFTDVRFSTERPRCTRSTSVTVSLRGSCATMKE